MTARSGITLVLLSSLLCVHAEARADKARHAIVVPTELGGYFLNRDQYRREVNLALEDRLRAAQFSVPTRSPLSASESDCRDLDCLTRIGDMHGADVVVAGRIVNNQQVKVSYRLRVRVVEIINDKPVTREREKDCENCAEPAARDGLATLMTAVLANEPETPPNGVGTAPVVPSPGPAPGLGPDNSSLTRDRLSPKEKVAFRTVGLVVGALGIGLLAQGFVELAHNGDIQTKNGQRYRVDTTTTGQPLFFTLGATTLLGGGILEAIGWWPWRVKVAASASSTGGQMQIMGRF